MLSKSLDFLGYPNYTIKENGDVIGSQGRINSHSLDKNGYHYICLHYKGKQRNYRIHQLVALAFIPNPENYPDVDHKDEDKDNNWKSNLQWCTKSQNGHFNAERKSCAAEKNGNAKLNWDMVRQIRDLYQNPNIKFNGSEIARDLGLKPQTISKIVNNKIWIE